MALASASADLVLVACSGSGQNPPDPTLLELSAPVHELSWSDQAEAVVALTQDDRHVATITAAGKERVSAHALSDVGENLAASSLDNTVYVPQPRLDQVTVLSLPDLHRLDTMHVAGAPSYLALDEHAKVLLALSEDGATVTGVDLHDHEALAPHRVDAGPDAELDGSTRDRRVEYHVVGPQGIALYQAGTLNAQAVERKGAVELHGGPSATDITATTRAYVAVAGTDRVVAVEETRTLDGLHVIASAHVGEPVREVAVDDTRLYVATDTKLVVFDTNSFIGFADGTIPVVKTINYRDALHDPALSHAKLAGMTAGGGDVYLAFEGQPDLLRIEAPDV